MKKTFKQHFMNKGDMKMQRYHYSFSLWKITRPALTQRVLFGLPGADVWVVNLLDFIYSTDPPEITSLLL